MGLKQSIVIKSEYTNNARSAPGKGSRGASPGQYVMRYMAREDATEVLAPVKLGYDSATFTRYIARSEATETLKAKQDDTLQDADAYGSPLVLKHKFRKLDKLSGRAFGSKGLSLSHEELEESSTLIQEAFDAGHSVQKIVLSFTEEYLRETGVLDPSFTHKGRGSYKGYIDQLKLRGAITRGVRDMSKAGRYINPEWVGSIQLDTSHVHAHIALCDKDFSKARMHKDGADRGKINEREKKMLRKGIHFGLADMRDLKSFHKQASLERQNVVAFVKDYAYNTLYENTAMQLLVAGLPKNRRHWRYRSNEKTMKHANELAVRIVERVFQQEPEKSGYQAAMGAVYDYANEAMTKNKLTNEEYKTLLENGREQIVERSVNGLYKTIKGMDPNQFQTRTEMTDIQSSSDEALARALQQAEKATGEFDPAAFQLRVRGYNKRRNRHAVRAKVYFDLATEFDRAEENGLVDDSAHVMRLFYEEEQLYHMGLCDKYRTFLSFHHPKEREQITKLQPAYETLVKRFQTIVSDEEETGLVLTNERESYKRELRAYTYDCFEGGVASRKEWDAITEENNGRISTRFVLPVRPKSASENLNNQHFQRVKALDVHHLGLDYYNKKDAKIDAKNAQVFFDAWQNRKQRADAAKGYVEATHQVLPVLTEALSDITHMEAAVEKAVAEGLITTVSLQDVESTEERQLYTLSVDQSVDVTREVHRSLSQGDFLEDMETQELE